MLEEDVQWVFINTLSMCDHTLTVTSERGTTYQIDLRRKRLPSPKPRGLQRGIRLHIYQTFPR